MKTLGEAIKTRRLALGMTQQSLGEVAGYESACRATISRIESGERSPSLGSLLDIADALGVKASELLAEAGL